MKKFITLSLCLLMLVSTAVSCGIPFDAEDKGAEIPMYLTDPVYNLDPAFAYHDDGAIEILSLIYEGLFVLDEDGEPVEAMCEDYETFTDRDGNFVCEFTIGDTKWNDGRSVSANDFVFAWQRLLEPDFSSPAASLLFDIKNARACKRGDVTIDDLGVVAVGTKILQVTFEREVDIDQFIEITASPALVPLREDKVSRLDNWATSYVTMVTNGPFYVKLFTSGDSSMTLERNLHYFRDAEEEGSLDEEVDPFRLVIYFHTPEEALAMYNNNQIVLNSNLALSARASAGDVEKLNTLSTHTYIFNNDKFDADTRNALSMAIDRNELAKLVTYAKAAQGFIPEGVFDTSTDNSFREKGGALISATADMTKAKELAKGSDIKEFTLTVREGDVVAKTVAEYAVNQWKELGFNVTIETLGFERADQIEYEQYNDLFYDAYETRDFDVIAVDSQMFSTYAFSALASYAKEFSGMSVADNNYEYVPHISGYDNKEYNELIEKAFSATKMSERSKLLHQAEEMLVKDMPAMPIIVYQNVYIENGDLSEYDTTYYGALTFTGAELEDYENYKVTAAE